MSFKSYRYNTKALLNNTLPAFKSQLTFIHSFAKQAPNTSDKNPSMNASNHRMFRGVESGQTYPKKFWLKNLSQNIFFFKAKQKTFLLV